MNNNSTWWVSSPSFFIFNCGYECGLFETDEEYILITVILATKTT